MKLDAKDVEKWVRRVLKAHDYQTIVWGDGSVGILNAPKRFCGVVADLTGGLVALAEGGELPELEVEAPKKKRASKKQAESDEDPLIEHPQVGESGRASGHQRADGEER